MVSSLRAVALAWALGGAMAASLACSGDEGEASEAPAEQREGLSATELLTRASLDLRGVRPSLSELEAVEQDPTKVDEIIDTFVDDPAFGARIKDMFAGAWRTRIDTYPLPEQAYEDNFEDPLHAAIAEEPLELIAYIALNDLPFSHVVESTQTFVDPALLELWPLQEVQEPGGEILPAGVVRARYIDGRPLAGVLSMNSVFWRHSSTVENANRGRANALSQALLCQSYLDRPIDFPSDLDLTDSESIRSAIATNAACQGCHSTLDPLASYLWGFIYPEPDLPLATYSVEQERAWQIYTNAPPAFFGKPGERMVDLAAHIAGDERFISCTVRRVYEGMLGRKAELEDEGALAVHRERFLADDLSLKALVRSILGDPSYRGEAWTPRFGGSPQPVYEKVAPVGVLNRSLATLSGYELRIVGRRGTSLDIALRRLAGGSDRGDTTSVSTGAVLVQRRLAEAGASHAVRSVLEGGAGGGVLDSFLGSVDLGQAPSAEHIVELVRLVRSRSLAEDDPEVEAIVRVWEDAALVSDPTQAWVAVITAMLADPDHLLY